jgi:hypothetical protein
MQELRGCSNSGSRFDANDGSVLNAFDKEYIKRD